MVLYIHSQKVLMAFYLVKHSTMLPSYYMQELALRAFFDNEINWPIKLTMSFLSPAENQENSITDLSHGS